MGLRSRHAVAVIACLAMVSSGRSVSAADWPQWRGPQRNAISPETGLLTEWPEGGPKLDWHGTGLGTGYASLAVSSGKLFTLGKREEVSSGKQEGENSGKIFITALDAATGQQRWTRQIGLTTRIPCSTPTVDGERVYALEPDGHLFCLLAASGEVVWQKDLMKEFAGRKMSGRGYGESPLIDGEKLICTPGGADAAMVAIEKRTGAVLWKAKLPELGPAGRDGAAFSSAVISEGAGIHQYVQLMGRGLVSVAAADGRFLWSYNGISNNMVNIPTPVVRDDFVFAANGYNAGSVLLRLVPENPSETTVKKIKPEVVWSKNANQFQNHHGGVLLVGEFLYGGHGNNNGLPSCLELKTGKILWKRRGPGVGSAAVAYADGRLYFRYQNGLVVLLEASPAGFEVRGKLQIPGAGGDSWSHPVIANGRLYLREQNDVWVYHLRNEPARTGIVQNPAQLAARETHRRLYEYAGGSRQTSKAPRILVLKDQHLAADGTFSAAALAEIQNVSEPFILNLTGMHVCDAGLKQLSAFPALAGLNLEFCSRITDVGLENLQGLQSLKVLILTGTPVTHVGVQKLVPIKSLIAVDLEACDGIDDAACEPLGEMRQLRALVLKKTGFEAGRISSVGLNRLRKLREIELLNLYGNNFEDAGLESLGQLLKLRELNLSLLAITDGALEHLRPLKELRQLDLLYSEGFAGPKITDKGVNHLAQLSQLTALNLTGARISDAGLERLEGLKGLTNLQLVRTQVTTAGLRSFEAAMPQCRVLK